MVQRTTGQRISTLFGKNLPSHPPDPVIEIVADDAELPYLRGVGHVSTYTGTIVVFPICGYDLVDLILYDLNLIIIRALRQEVITLIILPLYMGIAAARTSCRASQILWHGPSSWKSPASTASLDTYHDAIYVEFIPLRAKTPMLPMKYLQ